LNQFRQITSREVIKEAFAAKIIQDGDTWIKMLEHLNLMPHTYSQSTFEKAVNAIHASYLLIIKNLFDFFKLKVTS
jgi:nucleotidyltransferase substrate binding protein (TIGR01987 family)